VERLLLATVLEMAVATAQMIAGTGNADAYDTYMFNIRRLVEATPQRYPEVEEQGGSNEGGLWFAYQNAKLELGKK